MAVDISIWLFQVQAGRGGKNPELRTLFFRLLKLLALPIHPLFVYDGRHKPPFKRGKAVSARSYGNAPIIQRSKDLIERFRFPWHEAPGEAEAECARLQQAGIVDAVMSNDVDALMFGSGWTIMNFSKEKGTGTTAATHVTCYHMENDTHTSNVPVSRAGMILFAMLSGGDYLPGGVPKCGPGLAAEIAKASFGEDLLQEIASHSPDIESRLGEWRERLQYELEENESGYFTTKHKAVRIPETFPDRTILEYYAEPKVSTDDEMATLRRNLRHAWDREIDPLAIRTFAAEHFEWNYRSGARKIVKLLAEPLTSYRLRLQRRISGVSGGTLAPQCDRPWLQKVYKSRANFGTDGTTEFQMDILPIDVVGLDILAEEPAPVPPAEESAPTEDRAQEDEEEDPEAAANEPPATPSKTRVTKRYDPFAIEKIWVFETVAVLGVPDAVKEWHKEQAAKEAAKAKKAAPKPKKTTTSRGGPRKKGPIDPNMKRGSILKYGTLTKERSELSSSQKDHMFAAASSQSSTKSTKQASDRFQTPPFDDIDFTDLPSSMFTQSQPTDKMCDTSHDIDDLIDSFSSVVAISSTPRIKRHPVAAQSSFQTRGRVPSMRAVEVEGSAALDIETIDLPSPPISKRAGKSRSIPPRKALEAKTDVNAQDSTASPKKRSQKHSKRASKHVPEVQSSEVDGLEEAVAALSLTTNTARDTNHPREKELPKSKQPCLDKDKKPGRKDTESKKPTKAKKEETEPRQTLRHVENVSTCDGFWSVDEPGEPEFLAGDSEVHDTSDRRRRGTGKKRLPRVSYLDLA